VIVNPLDVAVVLVMVLFAGLGAIRGFVGEVFSLAAWAGGILAGWALSPMLMPALARWVHNPGFRRVSAFLLIFVVVFVLIGITGFMIRNTILKGGIKTVDHVFGALFGAIRGIVILVVLVMLADLTSLPRLPWWRGSHLVPYLQRAVGLLAAHLPAKVARTMGYR
jgi:membrane protein required for colicin V production